eukprot:gene15149-biopygen15224
MFMSYSSNRLPHAWPSSWNRRFAKLNFSFASDTSYPLLKHPSLIFVENTPPPPLCGSFTRTITTVFSRPPLRGFAGDVSANASVRSRSQNSRFAFVRPNSHFRLSFTTVSGGWLAPRSSLGCHTLNTLTVSKYL